jgi:hypothetical protein
MLFPYPSQLSWPLPLFGIQLGKRGFMEFTEYESFALPDDIDILLIWLLVLELSLSRCSNYIPLG